jgi:hypothetical protein
MAIAKNGVILGNCSVHVKDVQPDLTGKQEVRTLQLRPRISQFRRGVTGRRMVNRISRDK